MPNGSRRLASAALSAALLGGWASHALAEPATPAPCSTAGADKATLSASEPLNDVAKEFWSIEDETVNSRRLVNFVLGVTAAYGGWFAGEDKAWEGRFFVAPTAAVRIGKRQLARDYLVERDRKRLARLKNVVIPKITTEVRDELERVKQQRDDVRANLDKIAAPAAEAPDAPETAPRKAAPAESDARSALRRDFERELKALDLRAKELHVVLDVASGWSARACQLDTELNRESIDLVGGELMIGYGFDVATNPDDDPKSAVIGGGGANLALGGFAFGVGVFLHEAGIIGGYVDVGVPIFE